MQSKRNCYSVSRYSEIIYEITQNSNQYAAYILYTISLLHTLFDFFLMTITGHVEFQLELMKVFLKASGHS